jgi:hypothetical protein
MDEVTRLIEAFGSLGSQSSVALKLDILMDLEQIRDPRVIAFMLDTLADASEPKDVRVHVLRRVRNGMLTPDLRPRVAAALVALVEHDASVELRLQAALALGEFTAVAGVVAVLGAVASAPDEVLEIRYAAFTSLDRAGPTPEYLALLRALSGDEMLGSSAHSALQAWAPDPEARQS